MAYTDSKGYADLARNIQKRLRGAGVNMHVDIIKGKTKEEAMTQEKVDQPFLKEWQREILWGVMGFCISTTVVFGIISMAYATPWPMIVALFTVPGAIISGSMADKSPKKTQRGSW